MKPIAKDFKAKRCVLLKDIPMHNCPYIPEKGDVVLSLKNMVISENVLTSAFHVHTIAYVGITWSANTFTLLWYPFHAKFKFPARLEGFYEVGRMETWTRLVQCYYHPFDNEFTPVAMPCHINNFWKYNGFNFNDLDTVNAKDIVDA